MGSNSRCDMKDTIEEETGYAKSHLVEDYALNIKMIYWLCNNWVAVWQAQPLLVNCCQYTTIQ
jgi:hypothetical protein